MPCHNLIMQHIYGVIYPHEPKAKHKQNYCLQRYHIFIFYNQITKLCLYMKHDYLIITHYNPLQFLTMR